jgi:hypothetical protein
MKCQVNIVGQYNSSIVEKQNMFRICVLSNPSKLFYHLLFSRSACLGRKQVTFRPRDEYRDFFTDIEFQC